MDTSKNQGLPDPHRRNFLQTCITAMTGIAAVIVAYPVFSFLRLPRRIRGDQTIEVPLAGLSEDQALYIERQGTQIVLIYTHQEPKVFDAACTHLGCLVAWDNNDHIFHCPCHGAVFNDHGDVVSGPINLPLRKIKFEIKNNTLIIA
jgi:cytochrome b6-f complex iron-sulfur subunit